MKKSRISSGHERLTLRQIWQQNYTTLLHKKMLAQRPRAAQAPESPSEAQQVHRLAVKA